MPKREPLKEGGKFPWYAASAALKSRKQGNSWEQTADSCCPCGRAKHSARCLKRLQRAVEKLEHEEKFKRAIDSLWKNKTGRPADWPPHGLIAILRERVKKDGKYNYDELVQKYCLAC